MFAIPNQPLEQKLQAIADTQIKIKFDIEKLNSAVDPLVSKDRHWCTLIQNPSLPEADRNKEGKLYSDAVSDEEGHFSLILVGQDKLSELKAMVLELDHMHSSTERQIQIQLQEQFRGSAQPRASNVVSQQTPSMKLPKIELPKFNGEPTAWIAFLGFIPFFCRYPVNFECTEIQLCDHVSFWSS